MKLQRNAKAVYEQVFKNDQGQLITRVPCKIQIPVRYSEVNLSQIGLKTFTYGLFALILESGEYAVTNVNCMIELNQSRLGVTTIGDVDYHEFFFEADSVVFKTMTIVQRQTLMYNVMDEFVFKGKLPWYVEYNDVGKLFNFAKKYADSNVGQIPESMELLASMIARKKEDRTQYIRVGSTEYPDFGLDKIDFVALTSIFYSVHSTVNKIAGSYFNDGIVSALVNPAERVETIEKILRA